AEVFAAWTAAKDAANAARDAERAAEREERATDQSLIAAQGFAAKAARAAAERASRLASLEAEIRRLTQSTDAALESRRGAEAELAQLGDGIALTQDGATARARTAEARTAYSEARATLDGLKREG